MDKLKNIIKGLVKSSLPLMIMLLLVAVSSAVAINLTIFSTSVVGSEEFNNSLINDYEYNIPENTTLNYKDSDIVNINLFKTTEVEETGFS